MAKRISIIIPDQLLSFDPSGSDMQRLGEHDASLDQPHCHFHIINVSEGQLRGLDLGYHSIEEAVRIATSCDPAVEIIVPSSDLSLQLPNQMVNGTG